MKKLRLMIPLWQTFVSPRCMIIIGFIATSLNGWSQGTINFNNNQVTPRGTNYYELGMAFNVIIPTFGSGGHYDGMVITPGSGISNVPTNPTPYMFFIRLLPHGEMTPWVEGK